MKHSLLVLFLLSIVPAPGQVVTFGVKAGVPLSTAPFDTGHTETGRWTVGPSIEGHITKNLSIEVDALYRGYKRTGSSQLLSTIGPGPQFGDLSFYDYHYDARAWDLPLLVKYRFGKHAVRPFIDAGMSYTHESVDVTISCFGPICNSLSQVVLPKYVGRSTVQSNRWGGVGGAGVEVRWGKMRIAPEFRYTRINDPGGNQAALMVGFTF